MIEENISKLQEFENLSKRIVSDFNAKQTADGILTLNYDKSQRADLTVFAVVHGNEVVGAHVINQILVDIIAGDIFTDKKIHFVYANIEAFKQGERFLERDLNRSFDCQKPAKYEERRAVILSEILTQTDWLVDLHQTIFPTKTPFYIAKNNPKNIRACLLTNDSFPVVEMKEGFSKDGKTSIEYVSEHSGQGFVIELGEKGYADELLQAGINTVKTMITKELPSSENISPSSNVKPMYKFDYFYVQPSSDHPAVLNPGWSCFDDVKEGEVVGTVNGAPLKSPVAGKMIFPKYEKYQESSKELFGILTPV